MKAFKYLKLIVGLVFMTMFAVNIIMYFFIADSVNILEIEVNCLYVQVAFILIEAFFFSSIYGKKQGLTICLIYFILVVLNLMFIFSNLVW